MYIRRLRRIIASRLMEMPGLASICRTAASLLHNNTPAVLLVLHRQPRISLIQVHSFRNRRKEDTGRKYRWPMLCGRPNIGHIKQRASAEAALGITGQNGRDTRPRTWHILKK